MVARCGQPALCLWYRQHPAQVPPPPARRQLSTLEGQHSSLQAALAATQAELAGARTAAAVATTHREALQTERGMLLEVGWAGMGCHGTAWDAMGCHGMTWDGMAWHGARVGGRAGLHGATGCVGGGGWASLQPWPPRTLWEALLQDGAGHAARGW